MFQSTRFSEFTRAAVSTTYVDATLALAHAASRASTPPPHASPTPPSLHTLAQSGHNARGTGASTCATQRPGSAAQQQTNSMEAAWEGLLARESDAASMLLQHVAFELASGCTYAGVQIVQATLEWIAFDQRFCVCLACCYRVIVVWCWSSVVHRPADCAPPYGVFTVIRPSCVLLVCFTLSHVTVWLPCCGS
jgi:hypothetical protein